MGIGIGIVGLGSLGGEFLIELVGEYYNSFFHLVDMDKVEKVNIGRHPLFEESDIGLYKTDVIAKKYSNMKSYPICVEKIDMSFFSNISLLVCAVDSLITRRWLNWALYQIDGNIIFLETGCEGKAAHARIFNPIKGIRDCGPCIECTIDLYTSDNDVIPLCTVPSEMDLKNCVQWANLTCKVFDVNEIMKLAIKKADGLDLDSSLIDLAFCQKILNNTIPTDLSTNKKIAKEAIKELRKFYKGKNNKTVFITLQDNFVQVHYLLKSDDNNSCYVCG